MAVSQVFVFDIDGVIRTFTPERMAARLDAELGLPVGIIEDAAFADPLGRALVEGRMTRAEWVDEVTEMIARTARDADAARSIVAEWATDIGQLIPETIELIDELRQEHPVFALTNGTDRTAHELDTHGIADRFHRVLNSHEIGVAKPAPDCYARAHALIEQTLGSAVSPASVHFTDDLSANIEAAAQFGWRAVQFTDAAALRSSLAAELAS
ncbi:HAD-IA family hydrolase [Paramicrobacterium agarici]|uniref:Putative hydrolase of the HAD superfamily n=1 Tax=Paramicrobacterium agarici TaxID=630514 RepID=A0A2A9E1K2_9MICO|nr:HAD-IA family hydrolase [Microbacterium agarici]PFG32092.1 putative hydrolase of the HAD superfamily [Microbacterium agarici]